MLESAKNALRVSGADLDEEIQDLIDTAKADLKRVGILEAKIVETDPLIKKAVITYCKANFGWDNPEAERFQSSYESIRNDLSHNKEYTVTIS